MSLSKRLPDYFFGRDPNEEETSWLTGIVITDWPRARQLTADDKDLIGALLRRIVDFRAEDPNVSEIGIWDGDGTKPADGASPPFDSDALVERAKGRLVFHIDIPEGVDGPAFQDARVRSNRLDA